MCASTGKSRVVSGADLAQGLPIALRRGERAKLVVSLAQSR
jgi:hypothetical protein